MAQNTHSDSVTSRPYRGAPVVGRVVGKQCREQGGQIIRVDRELESRACTDRRVDPAVDRNGHGFPERRRARDRGVNTAHGKVVALDPDATGGDVGDVRSPRTAVESRLESFDEAQSAEEPILGREFLRRRPHLTAIPRPSKNVAEQSAEDHIPHWGASLSEVVIAEPESRPCLDGSVGRQLLDLEAGRGTWSAGDHTEAEESAFAG